MENNVQYNGDALFDLANKCFLFPSTDAGDRLPFKREDSYTRQCHLKGSISGKSS